MAAPVGINDLWAGCLAGIWSDPAWPARPGSRRRRPDRRREPATWRAGGRRGARPPRRRSRCCRPGAAGQQWSREDDKLWLGQRVFRQLGGHGLCEDCCDPFRAALVCAAGFSALAGRAAVTWFSEPRCSTPHAAPRKVFYGRRLLSLRRSPLGLLRWASRRCPYRGGPGRVLVAAQVRGDLGGGGGQAAVVAEAKQPGALAIVTPSLP